MPPLHLSNNDITSDPYSSNVNRQREILPSLLANSPPGRSSTLPPLQRPLGPNRPRKQSITKRGRESNHKKKSSRGSAADWIRRFQNEDRFRPANDRKALSAEPSADFGKRWEDLIDAADQAASAAGDLDDRTPVSLAMTNTYRDWRSHLHYRRYRSLQYQFIERPCHHSLTNFNLGATKHPRYSKL